MKKVLKYVNFILAFLPILVYIAIYNFMGELIPVSWNDFGEETSFVSKSLAVFIIPITTIFVYFILFFVNRIRGDKEIFSVSFETFSLFVIMTFIFISLFPLYLVNFDGGNRYDLMAYIMLGISFLVFISGFIFPRFKHEGKYGFITPWTKASSKVFYKTQSVASITFVIGSLFLALSSLFVNEYKTISFLGFVLVMLVIMFIPLLYSKRCYENE